MAVGCVLCVLCPPVGWWVGSADEHSAFFKDRPTHVTHTKKALRFNHLVRVCLTHTCALQTNPIRPRLSERTHFDTWLLGRSSCASRLLVFLRGGGEVPFSCGCGVRPSLPPTGLTGLLRIRYLYKKSLYLSQKKHTQNAHLCHSLNT